MLGADHHQLRQRRRGVRRHREQPASCSASRSTSACRCARVDRLAAGGEGALTRASRRCSSRRRSFYFAYIIAGVLAHPAWKEAFAGDVQAAASASAFRDHGYLYMVIGVVGTTIAPWMQFYLQASIVEKGITAAEYAASRWDVILGCIFTDVVAWFIIVACAATLYAHGIHDIQRCAPTPPRRCGRWPATTRIILFAAGLFNASLFAASILPLSTAYTVCEGLGFESGVDKKFHEAPVFYWLYTLLIVAGAGVHPAAATAAGEDQHSVAGGQRHRAAVCADLHAAADQQDAS